ncbi:MAG: DUF4143 domain-containing protein [Lentisphaerae bacterium]|nr:DUF4143 domain-containing protein [Lentisphaerota bacterium]
MKTSKLCLSDRGLMAHVIGIQSAAPRWHFRTAAGKDVDFALEAPDGRLVGVDVKASVPLRTDDFACLRELGEIVPVDSPLRVLRRIE